MRKVVEDGVAVRVFTVNEEKYAEALKENWCHRHFY